jgi:hypothetical protein
MKTAILSLVSDKLRFLSPRAGRLDRRGGVANC